MKGCWPYPSQAHSTLALPHGGSLYTLDGAFTLDSLAVNITIFILPHYPLEDLTSHRTGSNLSHYHVCGILISKYKYGNWQITVC